MRRKLVLLVLAVAVWLPALHLLFRPRDRGALTAALALRQRAFSLQESSAERDVLHRSNPEWDLMVRTFSVLSFANLALSEPARKAEHLAVVDALIARTLRDERRAHEAFFLPYVHVGPFKDPAGRSLFVDGELALMLAARQRVEKRADYSPLLRERVDLIAGQLERAPVLAAESYPDEGWTFCNTVALAALRLSDRVDGRDHGALLRRWVASAREHLSDRRTGLLVSSFTYDGLAKDGPEGSTLWLAAHMLQVVDADFASDQYQRARAALLGQALGFAWAAEWPAEVEAMQDIDSGPTIPWVNANAGSSGLALVGAAAFDDEEALDGLLTSLHFAAFPVHDDTGVRFAAGNPLADAVLLYALVEGPLWRLARTPHLEAHR
ncbi:linalool dehydratase/isomerase domain-containing protein [Corallococcus sp. M7]